MTDNNEIDARIEEKDIEAKARRTYVKAYYSTGFSERAAFLLNLAGEDLDKGEWEKSIGCSEAAIAAEEQYHKDLEVEAFYDRKDKDVDLLDPKIYHDLPDEWEEVEAEDVLYSHSISDKVVWGGMNFLDTEIRLDTRQCVDIQTYIGPKGGIRSIEVVAMVFNLEGRDDRPTNGSSKTIRIAKQKGPKRDGEKIPLAPTKEYDFDFTTYSPETWSATWTTGQDRIQDPLYLITTVGGTTDFDAIIVEVAIGFPFPDVIGVNVIIPEGFNEIYLFEVEMENLIHYATAFERAAMRTIESFKI